MNDMVRIVVVFGGPGEEREVSIASGEAVVSALKDDFEVVACCLDDAVLPSSLHTEEDIVFPVLHGTFGEDGKLQALLENRKIEYAGSDALASRLCMDKDATKEVVRELGIATPKSIVFDGKDVPLADDVINQLGPSLVVKPSDQGSSVGLHLTEHRSALGVTLSQIHNGRWLIEERIVGRELTVGILNGKAMGIVEIIPEGGVYDFGAKYTAGASKYEYPAVLDDSISESLKADAERIFEACGCRDFARIDFLFDGERPYFLEVNTLPGMTATSLLPKSASCIGLDFKALVRELIAPACERHANGKGAR